MPSDKYHGTLLMTSALFQVMAWCRQAASHYLSPCWTCATSPYGTTTTGRLSSVRSSDIHLGAISQWIPEASITKISLHIICLKFHSNLPGANELIPYIVYRWTPFLPLNTRPRWTHGCLMMARWLQRSPNSMKERWWRHSLESPTWLMDEQRLSDNVSGLLLNWCLNKIVEAEMSQKLSWRDLFVQIELGVDIASLGIK